MSESIGPDLVEATVAFHGHWCPGLALGIRASELALRDFGKAGDEEIVAVVETDMCGVDAIQFLTGCTFGKGNLIHRDYGKKAISERIMESGLEGLFEVKEPIWEIPRKARILSSLVCQSCGEPAMESRTRRLRERTLCIPCFERLDMQL